jgi:hypothetical protein
VLKYCNQKVKKEEKKENEDERQFKENDFLLSPIYENLCDRYDICVFICGDYTGITADYTICYLRGYLYGKK